MHKHPSALGVATTLKPAAPVTLIRPEAAARAARFFAEKFPGRSLYAVKANPSPDLIRTLFASGITHFDVASIAEVRLVAEALAGQDGAKLCFMHPVKAEEAIAEAYHVHGVRTFSLDTIDELEKIMRATGDATDLELCVRLRVSSEHSELSLASKFGAELGETRELLMATRQAADALGICFHVGSQAMKPTAWWTAMADVSRIIIAASVTVDIVDVGGGFPSIYADNPPPSLEDYAAMVEQAFENMFVLENAELWCEPGRALVAESESLLARIELVKDDAIYINDGSYGALYDAVHERWSFPMRALPSNGRTLGRLVEYTVYGPTCDSTDKFPAKVWLPAGLEEGDYLEFGNLGAYGRAMSSRFNGFGETLVARVHDAPWPSLYNAVGAEVISIGASGTR